MAGALHVASASAADGPDQTHCNASLDIAAYYGTHMAKVYKYTGSDPSTFISALLGSGYYNDMDAQKLYGASVLYVTIDDGDDTSTVFYYGDNGCAFGFDDGWDRESITAELSQIGLPLPSEALMQLPGSVTAQ